jgi:hypothetical protein
LFTGHYAVSFAGKAAEKCIPLWLLFIAVQFIDVLWSIFVLLGIECCSGTYPSFTRDDNELVPYG